MIKYHEEIVQGTEEWFAIRCGLLTASEMKLIMTPTLKPASNEKERCHMYELLAQRITGYVEPSYISDDMLRGHQDEMDAKILYNANYGAVRDIGFVTNDRFGFTLGFSPDGLIGDDGFIECKSRRQKFQVQTIIDGKMPDDYTLQVQTGLLVTELKWCDFISYSGGLPMTTIRIEPSINWLQTTICHHRALRRSPGLALRSSTRASDARTVVTAGHRRRALRGYWTRPTHRCTNLHVWPQPIPTRRT